LFVFSLLFIAILFFFILQLQKKKADFGFVDGTSKDGQKIAKRFGVETKPGKKGGKPKGALLAFRPSPGKDTKPVKGSVFVQVRTKKIAETRYAENRSYFLIGFCLWRRYRQRQPQFCFF
jgi:hypothetical protein